MYIDICRFVVSLYIQMLLLQLLLYLHVYIVAVLQSCNIALSTTSVCDLQSTLRDSIVKALNGEHTSMIYIIQHDVCISIVLITYI